MALNTTLPMATMLGLLVIFIVPVVGHISAILPSKGKANPLDPNALMVRVGRYEYMIGAVRDGAGMVAILVLLILAPIYDCWVVSLSYSAHLLILILFSQLWRTRCNHRAVLHLVDNPLIHPGDFMALVWAYRAPIPPRTTLITQNISGSDIDFRRPEKTRSSGKFQLFLCFFDSGCFASCALIAHKRLSHAQALTVFDTLARLWGMRCAMHLRMRLKVKGTDALAKVQNKTIIVLNHESLVDFALSFYATGSAPTGRGTRLSPRFIAAKDHFKDNVILYSIIGIGRAMEAAGMIFVERRVKGAARQAINQSIDALKTTGVDLAIFPQGTRAKPHWADDGRPLGAGYYTTKKGAVAGGGHFKTGAVRIAAGLSKYHDVDILPVAIVGTSKVVPARHFEVYLDNTIEYEILPPVTIKKNSECDPNDLSHQVELLLRKTARVHERLLDRWQNAAQKTEAEKEILRQSLSRWDDAVDPIPFAALDTILSYLPEHRSPHLQEFTLLASTETDDAIWAAFRERLERA